MSLDTSDLREANEKASKQWAEWTAKSRSSASSSTPSESTTSRRRWAQTVAQRVYASVLAGDDALRASSETANVLVLGLQQMNAVAVQIKVRVKQSTFF